MIGQWMVWNGIIWGGFALTASAMAYSVAAWVAVRTQIPASGRCLRNLPTPERMPPATIFKPLCGAEPETYDCLRSFCDQDYPNFQVVFGVADSNDPVVAIVERLKREFPHRDLDLVVDRRQHGSSRKVSNMVNMMPLARHDVFVISDSDVRVGRDYLARVVAPLLDPEVGIVTCPYRGVPRAGLWAMLGSQFINEWFMPSVRVAALGGSRSFAFGSTIAIGRGVLSRIGGFAAIANQLADDYRLGEMTRRLGLRTVLSDVVVETSVVEGSFDALVQHELRWLRTIRAVRPVGYGFSFVTFGVPTAAFGVLLSGGAPAAFAMLALTAAARLMLHFKIRHRGSATLQFLLLPLRDVLCLALWSWSFATRSVHWRNEHYRVNRDGSVLPVLRL
ncbi:MAG TPA: bacteriohopanetetrol glucosamine biosynthesis glycosyltransferase HpnI [Steroidobacteraceae bacterium]|nr:bacteriohopanetetrol glucosamine biosynthesis glycosyltransferase HpnI [Steroidobacteraceae bacterium]